MEVVVIGRPEEVSDLDWQELRETVMELYETWLTERGLEEPILPKKG